uniref:Sm domain-containing protein n=1 Tax=Calidris pygmaea TaxID=425635 RepID=A0A8C3PQE5_9CHAR
LLQLVELKNGETYNGHLVSCDNWMNINLREVICTSRVRLDPPSRPRATAGWMVALAALSLPLEHQSSMGATSRNPCSSEYLSVNPRYLLSPQQEGFERYCQGREACFYVEGGHALASDGTNGKELWSDF